MWCSSHSEDIPSTRSNYDSHRRRCWGCRRRSPTKYWFCIFLMIVTFCTIGWMIYQQFQLIQIQQQRQQHRQQQKGGGGGQVVPNDPHHQNHNNMNNQTLVIVFGTIRGGEIAWQSLYRNVLDINTADLALFISTDIRPNYINSSLFQRAKYIWYQQEYKDWGDALDIIEIETKTRRNKNNIIPNSNSSTSSTSSSSYFWRNSLLTQSESELPTVFGGVSGYKGSGAIVFAMRYFLSQKIQQLQLEQKYSTFIITRTDHYYQCTHNISNIRNNENNQNHPKEDDKLWIPKGEKYGGVCDRHLIVTSKNVIQSLNIFPTLFQYSNQFPTSIWKSNPETVLQYVWQYHNLSTSSFGRVMYCIAQEGDVTRWTHNGLTTNTKNHNSNGKHKKNNKESTNLLSFPTVDGSNQNNISQPQQPQVYYKYQSEYNRAIRYCARRQKQEEEELEQQ